MLQLLWKNRSLKPAWQLTGYSIDPAHDFTFPDGKRGPMSFISKVRFSQQGDQLLSMVNFHDLAISNLVSGESKVLQRKGFPCWNSVDFVDAVCRQAE